MSELGYMEKLLDGAAVEWRPLGEVAEYSPTRVDSTELGAATFVGVDNLVADKGGRVDASYLPNTARLTAYEPGDILLGNIRPYLKKVWKATNSGGCSGDVLAIRVLDNYKPAVSSEFLYYLLSSDQFFSYNMQHAKGAKMPRGSKDAILSYPIPIPCPENPEKSLAIQAEIVRILDAFTELTTELTARKKQYNHFRDQLLTFAEGEVEWKTLGELVTTIKTGKLNANAMVDNGEYPFFTCDANPFQIDTYAFDTEAIIVSGNGSQVGHINYYSGKFNAYQRTYILADCSSEISIGFLLAYLKAYLRPYIMQHSKKGSVPYITMPMLQNFKIPVPQTSKQARSVAILNKFDALTNSLSEGLPREIELRQKQYEHYRNLLLTFPKPGEAE